MSFTPSYGPGGPAGPLEPSEPAPSKAKQRWLILAGIAVLLVAFVALNHAVQHSQARSSQGGSVASSAADPTDAAEVTTVTPEDVTDTAEAEEAAAAAAAAGYPEEINAGLDSESALAAAGTDGKFRFYGPFQLDLDYSVMPYQIPLNPAGPQRTMVRWVDGLGYSPNQASEGTVYVLGHAWSQTPLALNPISEAVTNSVDWSEYETVTGTDGMDVTRFHSTALDGSIIAMVNDQGYTQQWVVDGAYTIHKNDAIADPELMDEEVPGKIVVIACAVEGSGDLEYNVVLTGHLRS